VQGFALTIFEMGDVKVIVEVVEFFSVTEKMVFDIGGRK